MGKTHLDRKNPQGPYAFVSYSHRDKEDVERALAALNSLGADFWYDTELRGGQIWIDKVKEVTANKNCVGIIYFISPHFIYSDACIQELELFKELKQSHDKFDVLCVFTDEEGSTNFNEFIGNAMKTLMKEYSDDVISINERIIKFNNLFKEEISEDRMYRTVAKSCIDSDSFVNKLFTEAFAAWGCASEEVDKLDVLKDDGLVFGNYRIKSPCRIAFNSVNGVGVEWKAFNYKGDTISAFPVLKELYETTCRSLAKNVMNVINSNVNLSLKTELGDKNEKHFKFDTDFLACVNCDENGNVLRFLRASEHEKYYLQIKEALESVSVSDAPDDGYFFVQDNKGNLLFADRGSEDVYRHIHVDAYASVIPVIDIDYVKYRDYVLKKEKA